MWPPMATSAASALVLLVHCACQWHRCTAQPFRPLPTIDGSPLVDRLSSILGHVSSAQLIDLSKDSTLAKLIENMIDSAHTGRDGNGRTVLNVGDRFKRLFNTSLSIERSHEKDGRRHTRLNQRLQDVRIWGADVIDFEIAAGPVTLYDDKLDKDKTVTIDVKKARFQHGQIFTDLSSVLSRRIDVSELHQKANKERGLDAIAKQFPSSRQRAKTVEPIIYLQTGDDGSTQLITGYYVHMMVDEKNDIREPHAIVDVSGNIVKQWNALATATEDSIDGIGGNEKIGEIKHDVKVKKRGSDCNFDSNKVKTVNLKNSYDNLNDTYVLSCDTKKVETNGAFGVPYDIQWAGEQIVNLYDEWYGTKPAPELPIVMKVHMGENYENAFYDNRKFSENGALFFGDGSSELHPPVTTDIVSHELGHSVVDHSSSLVYEGQSGALNEAFADMAAMAAKYYVGGGSVSSWQIGDGVVKFDGGRFRCVDDPTCDGSSVDHVGQWHDDLEVHQGSGVFNKAFYLIASKLKRGIWDAFDVFYTANTKFWTSTTTFTQAAEGVLNALDALKAGQVVWSSKYSYSWLSSDDFVNGFKEVGITCTKADDTWSCQ